MKTKPPVPATFHVGDKVRVKPGIKDEEYPDMRWAAGRRRLPKSTRRSMYTVRWRDDTLAAIDETYGLLCDAQIGKRKFVAPLGVLDVPRGKPNRQLKSDSISGSGTDGETIRRPA